MTRFNESAQQVVCQPAPFVLEVGLISKQCRAVCFSQVFGLNQFCVGINFPYGTALKALLPSSACKKISAKLFASYGDADTIFHKAHKNVRSSAAH